jgi:hypothetical protein
MSLEIKKEMEELRRMYSSDDTQNSFNLLLLGEMGTGKTRLISTCRRPIHIDSFDPGGTKHLAQAIKEGWLIVDSRWEQEDPLKPWVVEKWIQEMERRDRMGYFKALGTYAVDSMSMWNEAIMNRVLKKAGIAGQAPRFTHDYTPAKSEIKNIMSRLLKLPCDFVMTGHIVADKDEVEGSISMQLVTIGKLDGFLPSLFDEVWIAMAKDGAKGPEWSILTSPKGRYKKVRTRIGSGKFEQFEKPDVRELLKKAGLPIADKVMEETT